MPHTSCPASYTSFEHDIIKFFNIQGNVLLALVCVPVAVFSTLVHGLYSVHRALEASKRRRLPRPPTQEGRVDQGIETRLLH